MRFQASLSAVHLYRKEYGDLLADWQCILYLLGCSLSGKDFRKWALPAFFYVLLTGSDKIVFYGLPAILPGDLYVFCWPVQISRC